MGACGGARAVRVALVEEACSERQSCGSQDDDCESRDSLDSSPPPGLSTPGAKAFVGVDGLEQHQNPGTLVGRKKARKRFGRPAQRFSLR
jgi:hypothetical protein